jgi:Ricin-type beta-trefoil lectin domain
MIGILQKLKHFKKSDLIVSPIIQRPVVSVLILSILTGTIITFAFSLQNKDTKSKLNNILASVFNQKTAKAEGVSDTNGVVNPLQPRYYNTDKPFSIFVSCVYSDPANPLVSKAVFGYSNRTRAVVNLDESKISGSSNVWINDTAKYPTFPLNLGNKATDKLIKSFNPGDQERAFAVNLALGQDLIWEARIDYKNQASQYNTPYNKEGYIQRVRANTLFSPQCDFSGKSQFTEGFQSPNILSFTKTSSNVSSIIPATTSAVLSKVNLYVACSENDRSDSELTSALLGYRNESGQRIDLTNSEVVNLNVNKELILKAFGTIKGAKTQEQQEDLNKNVIQSHFQLNGANLENLNILKNQQYKNSTNPDEKKLYDESFKYGEIDYSKPSIFQKLGGAIQYLNTGQENQAMTVQGSADKDIIWGIRIKTTNPDGSVASDIKLVRANPKYDEPCIQPKVSNPSESDQKTDDPQNPSEPDVQVPSVLEDQQQIDSPSVQDSKPTPNTTDISIQNNTQTNQVANLVKSVLSFGSVQANAQSSNSTLDFNAACKLLGANYTAINTSSLANSWICNSGGGNQDVPYSQACSAQFEQGSVASYSDLNNINSWSCYSGRKLYYLPNQALVVQSMGLLATTKLQSSMDTNTQQWAFANGKVVNNSDRVYCLSSTSPSVGSSVYSGTCFDGPFQNNIWDTSGSVIKLQGSDLCLDSTGSTAGSDLVLGQCANSSIGSTPTNGGGGTPTPIPVDDDTELESEDLNDLANSYYSEQFAEINIPEDGGFIIKLIGEIGTDTYNQYNSATKKPTIDECYSLGFGCASSFANAQLNQSKIAAYFVLGLLKGAGQSVVDLANLIKELVTNIGGFISGLVNAIQQLFQQPGAFARLLVGGLQDFANKDIFGKTEFLGSLVGQFIPDIILSFFTGGSFAGTKVAETSVKVFEEVTAKIRVVGKIANIAENFIGKTLYLTKELSIPIVKVGEKIGMYGMEVLEKLKNLKQTAFEKFLEIL